MKYLDKDSIKKAYKMKEAIPVVEAAFKEFAEGTAIMPPKQYLDLKQFNGDFRAMPAYVPSMDIAGIKWVNSHGNNPKKGIDSVMATIIVNKPETGEPIAVLDGTYITAVRTGASGGVATNFLAKKDAKIAAFIGGGAQAYYQCEAICLVRDIEEVRIVDLSPETTKLFTDSIAKFFKGKITVSSSIEECSKNADIITLTTPSRTPLLKSEWVSPGTHINAIGADAEGKQECDTSVLKKALVFIDDWPQASHSGEINVPLTKGELKKEDIKGSIGELVSGTISGRQTDQDITLFDSTGLAIHDIASAGAVLSSL
ncbi:ornithine cyclodeaminase family protein [Candidatus Marinamargulisbacteria bacterium SCGC AAA071-K20]|nr:ornithine cyclodeaminase family protein [Candidatus Marinamargulisbacteria bacterium SCGC AAA071-K20]